MTGAAISLRALFAAMFLSLCGADALAQVTPARSVVRSGEVDVPVTRYNNAGASRRPWVLLLPDASGAKAQPQMIEAYAQAIVGQGVGVYVVDYEVAAGEVQVQAVRDVLLALIVTPETDPNRVGLLGFGQGATLAASVAAVDARVRAVVGFYGRVPDALRGRSGRMPPFLILHGEADETVPAAQAMDLRRILLDRGSRAEVKLYKDAGHGFSAQLDGENGRDALARMLAFFGRNL